MTIDEAKSRIEKEYEKYGRGDSESSHIELDDVLEEKLSEYEPEFVKELIRWYDEDLKASRWHA